jgi:cytochrome P450
LTRYEDIVAFATSGNSSTATQNLVPASPRSGLPRKPLHIDPPEHALFRRAMNPYFVDERIAPLEPDLRGVAAQFLQPLLERGHGDLMAEYAQLLPMRAICAFLRIPLDEAEFLQQTSSTYVEAVGAADKSRADDLSRRLDDFARRLAQTRKEHPLDPDADIVTGLLQHGVNGQAIGVEVVAGFVRGLLVAADRGTANGIGSSIMHLAQDADLQNELRTHPEGIPAAIDEFLRLYSPSAATARTTLQATHINGTAIKAGQTVAMIYLAANRDPEVFPNPDTFDLNRRDNRHLAFGSGVHKCAGQSLALLQLRVAIAELLARTKRFSLKGTVSVHKSFPEFGPTTLPVQLSS